MDLEVSAGWQAQLELAFERRLAGTVAGTVLVRNGHRGPLQVQKALYPEGSDTCHVAVLHPPGGIAAGDNLTVSASVGAHARALLTTPGATKWYRSEKEQARQRIHFMLAENSVLEWLPRENIIFDGSNISMSLDVALSEKSQYLGWEILSFGRRAAGDRWLRGRLQMRTSIRLAGRLLWSEVAGLDAGGGFARSSVGLAGFTVCGTLIAAGTEVSRGLLDACRAIVVGTGEARVGITCVPDVLIARYLGNSTEQAFGWFTDLWSVLRPALTQRAACPPRVWAC